MVVWKVDMSGEGESSNRWASLADGEYAAVVEEVSLVPKEKSGTGNPYFLWILQTAEGKVKVITTLLKGKRWLLKQMLLACGISSNTNDPDEKYSFAAEDVVGQEVSIVIKNKPNKWTNPDGVEKTSMRPEVVRIQKLGLPNTKNAEDIPF